MTRECSKCGKVKPISDYYIRTRNDGRTSGHHAQCKDCMKLKNRSRSQSDEERAKRKARYSEKRNDPDFVEANKIQGRELYASLEGRARALLNSANRRCANYPEPMDLDIDHIMSALNAGRCQLTGIPFRYDKYKNCKKNPFSPSIDRVDNSKGYTKANTRIVLWQVNLMHGELHDCEMLDICMHIIKGLSHDKL
jgi:hypothetical protein